MEVATLFVPVLTSSRPEVFEFGKTFKNTFSYRPPPVAASKS